MYCHNNYKWVKKKVISKKKKMVNKVSMHVGICNNTTARTLIHF